MARKFKTTKPEHKSSGQPKKDSKVKRVNFDNERESDFNKKYEKRESYRKDKKASDNDVVWYAKNPQMLKASATYPMSTYSGQPLTGSKDGYAFPGIMAIHYDVALGGLMESSIINTAKQSMYSFVVHANSRNTSYTDSDLMMLCLAGNEIFRAIAHAIRAYGVMKTFSQMNKYLGSALVRSLGFGFNDLSANYPKMWFDINRWVAMSAQIWVPNTLPFVMRQFWMNSNVYYDANSIKAQLYVYVPAVFYQYSPTLTSKGGGLSAEQPTNYWDPMRTAATWASYATMVDNMFAALLGDEDRGLIFGDILKAYGADKLFAINEIASDYTVVPTYSAEVLTQINNAFIYPTVNKTDLAKNVFTQDENGNIFKRNYITKTSMSKVYRTPRKVLMNFMMGEDPTPEQVMVATRMLDLGLDLSTIDGDANGYWRAPMTGGTEYAMEARIYNYKNGTLFSTPIRSVMEMAITDPTFLAVLSAFDWAPYLYVLPSDVTTAPTMNDYSFDYYLIMGDVENWTELSFTELTRLHSTAIFSEFDVPTLG